MKNQPLPATRNEAWGFWGTMGGQAKAAWPLAITAISEATGEPPEAVRTFLDSRHGRHFADDVKSGADQGLADAIEIATKTWMAWRISANTARKHGIPRGLPYLTGFVLLAQDGAE